MQKAISLVLYDRTGRQTGETYPPGSIWTWHHQRKQTEESRMDHPGRDAQSKPSRLCACGASLAGKRRGAKWCSDTCRKRLGLQNNPETHIQNKGFADAKIDGWWGGSLEVSEAPENGKAA